jgi:hypothetical protein
MALMVSISAFLGRLSVNLKVLKLQSFGCKDPAEFLAWRPEFGAPAAQGSAPIAAQRFCENAPRRRTC